MSDRVGRNTVFIVTFLATFAIVIGAIPSYFLIPTLKNYETLYVPEDSWFALELGLVNGTYPIYDNDTVPIGTEYGFTELTLGDITLEATFADTVSGNIFWIRRSYSYFYFFTGHNDLYLEDLGYVTYSTAIRYLKNENLTSFTMKDDKYTYHVSLSYDRAKFNNFAEAWLGTAGDTAELRLFVGMTEAETEFMYEQTTNAWNLINQILFFQSPLVHPLLNAILAIPIWISVAYLIAKITLWIISAPLGGGG